MGERRRDKTSQLEVRLSDIPKHMPASMAQHVQEKGVPNQYLAGDHSYTYMPSLWPNQTALRQHLVRDREG